MSTTWGLLQNCTPPVQNPKAHIISALQAHSQLMKSREKIVKALEKKAERQEDN